MVAVDRLPRSMMLESASFLRASLRAHGSARCHNNTHAYFVSPWEKEAERDDYFRTAPTENSGPGPPLATFSRKTYYLSEFQTKKSEQVRNVAKFLSDSRHCFSLFSLYFQF